MQRARTGRGDRVDVAMLDCQVALLENAISRMQIDGKPPGPLGSRHPSIAPFDVFRASDGWFVIAAGNDGLFQRLCLTLALPAVAADPRFATNPLRCENHAALKAALERRLAVANCAHWQSLLMQHNIPTGAYNNVAQVLQDPQVVSRDMLLQVKTQSGRALTVAGNPIHVGAHRTPLVRQPPGLDQDRERILASLQALRLRTPILRWAANAPRPVKKNNAP